MLCSTRGTVAPLSSSKKVEVTNTVTKWSPWLYIGLSAKAWWMLLHTQRLPEMPHWTCYWSSCETMLVNCESLNWLLMFLWIPSVGPCGSIDYSSRKHCSKEIHDTYGRKDEQVSVLNVGSVLDHPSYFYPYSATPNSETHPRTLPATPEYTRFAF